MTDNGILFQWKMLINERGNYRVDSEARTQTKTRRKIVEKCNKV